RDDPASALGHGAADWMAVPQAGRPHQRWRTLDRPDTGALAYFHRWPAAGVGRATPALGAGSTASTPAACRANRAVGQGWPWPAVCQHAADADHRHSADARQRLWT